MCETVLIQCLARQRSLALVLVRYSKNCGVKNNTKGVSNGLFAQRDTTENQTKASDVLLKNLVFAGHEIKVFVFLKSTNFPSYNLNSELLFHIHSV